MDLATILRRGEVSPELTPTGGALPGVPTTIPEDITGIKRVGNILIAGVIKALEVILPLYGVETEEGKRIKRAISNLSPLSKGITTEDLLGFLKMLGSLLQTPGRFWEEIEGAPRLTPGTAPGATPGAGGEAGTGAGEAGAGEGLVGSLVGAVGGLVGDLGSILTPGTTTGTTTGTTK